MPTPSWIRLLRYLICVCVQSLIIGQWRIQFHLPVVFRAVIFRLLLAGTLLTKPATDDEYCMTTKSPPPSSTPRARFIRPTVATCCVLGGGGWAVVHRENNAFSPLLPIPPSVSLARDWIPCGRATGNLSDRCVGEFNRSVIFIGFHRDRYRICTYFFTGYMI